MADRTKREDRTTIEVHVDVREQLTEYKAALKRQLRLRPTSGELISALLSGVPVWQAAAMLDAYRPIDDHGSGDAGADD